MAEIRATDADRERTAEALRGAAGDGALTVEELDARLQRAYGAVTRGELTHLVADLPVAPPPPAVRRSLFWLWALVPWFGSAAWLHAGLVTRASRYFSYAGLYAVPLVLGFAFDEGTGDDVVIPDWVVGVAIVFWIAGIVHAVREREGVDALRARRGTTTP